MSDFQAYLCFAGFMGLLGFLLLCLFAHWSLTGPLILPMEVSTDPQEVYTVSVEDGECSTLMAVFVDEEESLELAQTLTETKPPTHRIVVEVTAVGEVLERYHPERVFEEQGQMPLEEWLKAEGINSAPDTDEEDQK